jgi:hypothetical protein
MNLNSNKYNYFFAIKDPKYFELLPTKTFENRELLWRQLDYLNKLAPKILSKKQYKIYKYLLKYKEYKLICIKLNICESEVCRIRQRIIKKFKYFLFELDRIKEVL